ncbi:MarR family winged helix-turn-helix transcriptional regulator [Kineosporia babensis]|uniref:MarR family transcriptional regulator n=1 Tax=Kineosporia babensis TaxID=499548 RepID=A0A9X1SXF3_9ACTN|nr:MarR family transcriptional regulator [Kineosporia babensis]MCD5315821.1 MarR family transcriptional regulator [Kineosporia babensis]
MDGTEESLAQSRALTRSLILLAERVKADFADAVAPLDMPASTARVLLVLAQPTRMSDLAEQLGANRSYASGVADQLEKQGLLTRVTGSDRRVRLVALTEQGHQLREKVAEAVTAGVMITQIVTEQERQTLQPILEAVLARYAAR